MDQLTYGELANIVELLKQMGEPGRVTASRLRRNVFNTMQSNPQWFIDTPDKTYLARLVESLRTIDDAGESLPAQITSILERCDL